MSVNEHGHGHFEYYVSMYRHGHLSLFRVRYSRTFTDIYEIYDIYEEYMLKLLASDAKKTNTARHTGFHCCPQPEY